MADDRSTLYLKVTDVAHEGWVHSTKSYGGNPTTLAEILGLELADLDVPFEKLPPHWRRWFRQADQLEETRRKGQGKKKR